MKRQQDLFAGKPLFLTDSGLETDLIFNRGIDLPCFAAITLLMRPDGEALLRDYYLSHAGIAESSGLGFVLESVTWRASPDWAAPLGLSGTELDGLNRRAVALLHDIRRELSAIPTLVSGCIGPRGDGYVADAAMNAEEAHRYHRHQARLLAEAGVDLVTALTMPTVAEAIGVARAVADAGVPLALSFTVEVDGTIPEGVPLLDAIAQVEEATSAFPLHYMVNCAHPDHFGPALDPAHPATARIGALRANASRRSHAELEAMTELDAGNPAELGRAHADLLSRHPGIRVVGGCCGTDIRHVAAIASALR